MNKWYDEPLTIVVLMLAIGIAGIAPITCLELYFRQFPVTVEGTVISYVYSTSPPYPCTTITITNLGDSATTITIGGCIQPQIGKVYRITYHTPLGYWFAVIDEMEVIN